MCRSGDQLGRLVDTTQARRFKVQVEQREPSNAECGECRAHSSSEDGARIKEPEIELQRTKYQGTETNQRERESDALNHTGKEERERQ
jgi:hypothetical protein